MSQCALTLTTRFDNSYMIFVEYSEHKRSEFRRVSVWKELGVDFDEALQSISPTCYTPLLRQFPFAKKIQT